MMATVPHITSGLGLSKFQADGSLDQALAFFVNPNLLRTKTLLSLNTSGTGYPVEAYKPRDAATYTTRRSL